MLSTCDLHFVADSLTSRPRCHLCIRAGGFEFVFLKMCSTPLSSHPHTAAYPSFSNWEYFISVSLSALLANFMIFVEVGSAGSLCHSIEPKPVGLAPIDFSLIAFLMSVKALALSRKPKRKVPRTICCFCVSACVVGLQALQGLVFVSSRIVPGPSSSWLLLRLTSKKTQKVPSITLTLRLDAHWALAYLPSSSNGSGLALPVTRIAFSLSSV